MKTNTASYKNVSWGEVRLKYPQAYQSFVLRVCDPILQSPKHKLIAQAILGKPNPTRDDILSLFPVKAKHNWGSMSARADNDLLSLLLAAGMVHTVVVEYVWTIHHPWWHIERFIEG